MRTLSVFRMLPLLAIACTPKVAPAPIPAPEPPPPAPTPAWALDVQSAMDPTANACEDFYQYACGGWVKSTPLPADKPSYGRSFNKIFDSNLDTLHTVLEAAAKDPGTDPVAQKIGAYYGSCMDEAGANAAGLAPMKDLLAPIAGVKDVTSFMKVAGQLGLAGVNVPVRGEIDADFTDPTVQILFVMQGGLSLPDREYYLKTDEGSAKQLAALEAAITAYKSALSTAKAAQQSVVTAAADKAKASLATALAAYQKTITDAFTAAVPFTPSAAFADAAALFGVRGGIRSN